MRSAEWPVRTVVARSYSWEELGCSRRATQVEQRRGRAGLVGWQSWSSWTAVDGARGQARVSASFELVKKIQRRNRMRGGGSSAVAAARC